MDDAKVSSGQQRTSSGAWMAAIRRHPRAWYFVALVIAVTICFFGVNALMLVQGRELVWTADAQPLYVNYLTWWVQTAHQMFGEFVSTGHAELPDYTFSLGYGADVPMTMGSYLQDPINFVALLFPASQAPLAYAVMTWLRMVLAAVTFSAYCFERGRGRMATGVAALAYVTCGYVLFWGILRHSKFVDWAILLPLIFLGADRLFKGKSPVVFIVAFALQFTTSIYTSYMSCLGLLVYCLVKYFASPRERSVKDFALLVGKFLMAGIAAFLISAVFSVPQVGALLSQSRATSGAEVAVLNSAMYYIKTLVKMIGADVSTNCLVIGSVSTIALFMFALCGRHYDAEERKPWLVALVLCIIGICIPYVGHVFNGMGYSTDRWALLLGFVASYIVCLTVPVIPELDAKDWKKLSIGAVVVIVTGVIFTVSQVLTEDGILGMVSPVCVTCAFAIVFVAIRKVAQSRRPIAVSSLMGAAVVLCATLVCGLYCSPAGWDWAPLFARAGVTADRIGPGGPAAPIDDVEDDSEFRFSYPRLYSAMKNSSLTHGTMAVDFYSSYYNQKVDDFRQEVGISDHYSNFSFIGSDARLALDMLTGVKYYVIKDGDEWRLPYGFDEKVLERGDYTVYRSSQCVPLAFLTDRAIPSDTYESLTMPQKQEALLQGAAVDTAVLTHKYPQPDLTFASQSLNFEVVKTDGLEYEDGVVRTTKRNAKLTVSFTGLPKSETYLVIENLDADSYSPIEVAEALGEPYGWGTRLRDMLFMECKEFPLRVIMNDNKHSFTQTTRRHVRDGGKVDWVINMGYNAEPQTEMTLRFTEVGEYTFDSLEVVCQPVEPITAQASRMAARGLDDLVLETDTMRATAELEDDDPQLAVFMVADAPGWSVKVDGDPAPVVVADTGFMAVELQGKGVHEIEWRYANPFAHVGLMLTLAGLVLTVVVLVVLRLRNRHNDVKR